MIDSKREKIEQMVGDGKTIVQICNELDLEWKDVSNFLHSIDKKSWLGAKRVITNRLKRLQTEKTNPLEKHWCKTQPSGLITSTRMGNA